MPHRVSWICTGLLAGAMVLGTLPPAEAQQDKPKTPLWTHAFNLKCRNSKQTGGFDDKTKTYGMEVFKDENTNLGIFLLETGSLGVTSGGFGEIKAPIKDSKALTWMHGMDVKVRKTGEDKFTDSTQVLTIEVYKDDNTGNWVYITEKGYIAVAPGAPKTGSAPTPGARGPVWLHGLDLKCRKGGEKKWDNDTKNWSMEIFRDENTGLLIYIVENGAISVVGGSETAPAPTPKSLAPQWLHGLDLKCRKGGVKNFEKTTPVFGLELFRDANNANYIYLSEVGSIAVVRGDKAAKAPTEKPAEPEWKHGLDLKCRTFDEPTFNDKTRIYGVEVFNDPNTRTTLYIDDIGHIAAVGAK
jgi:hypothetical protein